jgi:Ca2+-binding EF-hand superfamily protein
MILQKTERCLKLQSRILRRNERIAKWDKESNRVESSWSGGFDYRRFCQGMADSAFEKRQELQAELKQLDADQDGVNT